MQHVPTSEASVGSIAGGASLSSLGLRVCTSSFRVVHSEQARSLKFDCEPLSKPIASCDETPRLYQWGREWWMLTANICIVARAKVRVKATEENLHTHLFSSCVAGNRHAEAFFLVRVKGSTSSRAEPKYASESCGQQYLNERMSSLRRGGATFEPNSGEKGPLR